MSLFRHAPTRSVVFILERGGEQQGTRRPAAASPHPRQIPLIWFWRSESLTIGSPLPPADRAQHTVAGPPRRRLVFRTQRMARDTTRAHAGPPRRRLSNSDAQACSAARRCRVTAPCVGIPTYCRDPDMPRHVPSFSVFLERGGEQQGTRRPAAATTVQQRRPGMLCCPEMSRDRALRRYSDILSRSRHAPTRSVVFILERGAEQQSTRRPAAASPRLSNSGDGPLHYAPCWPVRPELVQIDSARRRCCALRLRSCQTRKHRVHWMLVVARSGRCVIAFPGMTRSKPERAAPSTGRVDLRRAWSRPRL